jgi:Cys-tRNA(Pro)/Cys-tRNA(Cys) deacylase
MAAKLNAMRLLEQHHIPYEAVTYDDAETFHSAEGVADILGVPPRIVYKTLVVEPVGGGKPALALVASDRSLDLKKLAAAMGTKKVSMAAHKDAERLTGLKVGGISPLALVHKNWTVYLDQPATALEHILISAGQRGTQVRVPTAALVSLLRARVAEISAPTGE